MNPRRSAHGLLQVALVAHALGCDGSLQAPVASPRTPVAPADPCAAPLAEAAALEADGRLVEASERLTLPADGACRADAPTVSAARAALARALGDDDPRGDTIERAEALAAEAATAAAAGQSAQAERGFQRARRMLERVTRAKATRFATAGAEILKVTDSAVWLALAADKERALGRFEVRGEPLRLVPSLAVDGDTSATLRFGTLHPSLVLVSGSSSSVLQDGRGTPRTFEALGAFLLPDEERVLAVETGGVALRAVSDGHVIQRLPLAGAPGPGSVSKDGRFYQSSGVLVDLGKMEAVVDVAGDDVRESAVSPGFKAMAVVRAEQVGESYADALLLWRLDRPVKSPVKVAQVGSWLYGAPLLDFSRDETKVRVGYVEMAAMGVRPHAVAGSSYDVATGRRAATPASAFGAVDHYAAHAQRAAELARALGPGYQALPEQFSISMDSFWPPSATSADGGTTALVAGRRDAEDVWHDAQLVVFDRSARKLKLRLDLKQPEIHRVSVEISPRGRWIKLCAEECSLIDASTGALGVSPFGEGGAFSDDDRFLSSSSALFELASRSSAALPAAVCRVGPVLTVAEVCPAGAPKDPPKPTPSAAP